MFKNECEGRWLRIGGMALLTFAVSACGVLSDRAGSSTRRPAPVVTAPSQQPTMPVPLPEPQPEVPNPDPARAQAALKLGLQAYRDGKYTLAEAQFRIAVREGLPGPDQANAHKHLAFIYCTSQREALCAESFRSAKRADPRFKLSRAEAGHPMWGKVYKRALRIK